MGKGLKKNRHMPQENRTFDMEGCKDCEKIIREDEGLKAEAKYKQWTKEIILEVMGDHKKNAIQISKIWRSIELMFILLLILGILVVNLYTRKQ